MAVEPVLPVPGEDEWEDCFDEAEKFLEEDPSSSNVVMDKQLLKKLLFQLHSLRDVELLWRNALESAGDGVWDWHIPSGRVFFSPSWKLMIGYRDDEISNRYEEWYSRVHPDDIAQAEKDLWDQIEGRTPSYRNQHRLRKKDGSWCWILDRGKVVERDREGKPLRMVGTHTDITPQVLLRQELERHRRFFTRAQEIGEIGHWEIDLKSGLADGSEETRKIYGVADGFLTLEEVQSAPLPEYRPLLDKALKELVENGVPYDVEFRLRSGSGEILDVHSKAEYDREYHMLFGIIQNITDRKSAERQIRELLSEKELLLREVHHRVKNNMSLIASLISLQSAELHNSEAVEALQELKGRVNGMQLLYDRLYRTDRYDRSALHDYLGELLFEIKRNLLPPGDLKIEVDIETIYLNIPKIFPIGIMVNELVTNAIKHAYRVTPKGVIMIRVKRLNPDRGLRIIVQDDGSGIREGISAQRGGGFGLEMVRLMVRQLSGDIVLERLSPTGTAWHLTFQQLTPSLPLEQG
ncbi:sensor histidine kinase [Sediminispirochaeta bajacaliforniensis]|uniref:sensor histidine kinase n=1 Tax=Sediminispirochaeta bajacaliforniensis TaxID=148 RepID=UPI0003744A29|nr:PAS domain-containing protein [Sediminispirochaeta bajacaliforniensis]